MSANAMHLSISNDAYTPWLITACMRMALGGTIDLDPASSKLANTVVKAKRIYTINDDGVSKPWGPKRRGANGHDNRWTVACNPPGGKTDGNKSRTAQWWKHGVSEWLAGRVKAMCWVAFKLDFLSVTQGLLDVPLPLDFPICYPKDRLAYLTPQLPGPTVKQPNRKATAKQMADHAATGLCTADSPPHASAIVFLPDMKDRTASVNRFMQVFAPIGIIVNDGNRLNDAINFKKDK